MQRIRTRSEMRAHAARLRAQGRRLGFVPTMGALHQGHLSLLERVRDCDTRVASIFVNPIQFGPSEDLERYPRDLEADAARLQAAGCDVLFAPEAGEMYAPEASTRVVVGELEDALCGRSRPGHFRGVATVVTKLFHIVQPHVAVFGQKDAQQVRVLQRMCDDLDFDVEIRVAPIVRDPDGLALSSRNAYLDASARAEALLLHESLQCAHARVRNGERDAARVRDAMRDVLKRGARLGVDYVELVDTESLRALDELAGRVLIAVAATVDGTRLIDNLVLDVRRDAVREATLEAPGSEQDGTPAAGAPSTQPGRTNATT